MRLATFDLGKWWIYGRIPGEAPRIRAGAAVVPGIKSIAGI
jgi:hypothetical protein